MDIDHAVNAAQARVAPGIDSQRAEAICAYHAAIKRLEAMQCSTAGSKRAREALVRLNKARIDALSREVA